MQGRASTNMGERADLSPDVPTQALMEARYDAIEALAGPVAEMRQLSRAYVPYMSAGQVINAVLEAHAVSIEMDDDFGTVSRILGWLQPSYPVTELRQLWLAACNLVHIEWPGIRRVAQELRRLQEIDGGDFEALWRTVRPTEQTRRRRAVACAPLSPSGYVRGSAFEAYGLILPIAG
jgi:hypothetical protein